MRRFMRDNPLQHRGGAELVNQAVMQENRIVADDEGIERTVVDDQYLDAVGAKPRCTQHRCSHLTQGVFHVGIAQQAGRLCGQRQYKSEQQGGD